MVHLAALYHFFSINDISINRKKLSKFIGEQENKYEYRSYTHDEVSRLLVDGHYADWSKIHVVHVGVSPMFLDHGPARAVPRLVNIGRIVEQKGQAILIQAAAQLRDREIDFELVIVGDGPSAG